MQVELLSELSAERLDFLFSRSALDVSDVYQEAAAIVADVRARGDAANLSQHAPLRPGAGSEDLKVSAAEIDAALALVNQKIIKSLALAAENIRAFHAAQLEKPQWEMEIRPGIRAGRKHTPLGRVGCYVPGMRAVYPSTALMTILPAMVAGVEQVIVCTPPGAGLEVNPQTLAACHISGVKDIYKLGGPWAIASMAYGTALIPKVDKIVGPGTKYVTASKMLVFGQVDIDSPAGPSEALIIADDMANPEWLALDFLAQMEHDPDSAAILLTPSLRVAQTVASRIEAIIPSLPRREILRQSGRYAAILVVEDLRQAIEFSNRYAPEHLQIDTGNPWEVLAAVKNAGSIFLGPYAPVAAGDYASGTNHVLPTAGGARMFSGLSVDDFIKKPTYQYLSREGLASIASAVVDLAENEGLTTHALSVKQRLRE
jgi:histidinol dehydrogenase